MQKRTILCKTIKILQLSILSQTALNSYVIFRENDPSFLSQILKVENVSCKCCTLQEIFLVVKMSIAYRAS